ncbi:OsmC family protein [Alkalibacterium iburiense]|uniref:OsmC family protein n=1 Tax=Alkalibacterium iburiense TaxID=290589 RepID=A0ABN0X2K3_9LACT
MSDYLYETVIHNSDGVDGVAYVEGEKELSVVTSSPMNDLPGTNPEQLFGLAMTTCLNATIQSLLKGRGLTNKSHVSAKIQLKREDSGVGFFFDVSLSASIENMELDEAKKMIESAEKRCPVAKLTHGSQTIHLETVPYK